MIRFFFGFDAFTGDFVACNFGFLAPVSSSGIWLISSLGIGCDFAEAEISSGWASTRLYFSRDNPVKAKNSSGECSDSIGFDGAVPWGKTGRTFFTEDD